MGDRDDHRGCVVCSSGDHWIFFYEMDGLFGSAMWTVACIVGIYLALKNVGWSHIMSYQGSGETDFCSRGYNTSGNECFTICHICRLYKICETKNGKIIF